MWKKILTDDSGLVTGIFFQDSPMKRFFDKYPELLLLDATYKLTNTHMPLHVMLCVGPNGESEIVPQFFKDLTAAIGCMRHEREQALLTATDKVCVRHYAADSVQAQFSSALTPFATSVVLQQLQLAEANQQQLPSTVTLTACFRQRQLACLAVICWHTARIKVETYSRWKASGHAGSKQTPCQVDVVCARLLGRPLAEHLWHSIRSTLLHCLRIPEMQAAWATSHSASL